MKFLSSWITEAYYAYTKRSFELSIPFLHNLSATNLSIRYCPTFNKLIVKGKISSFAKAIYDPFPIEKSHLK